MMIREKLTVDTLSMCRAIEDKGFALKLYLRLKEYEDTDLSPEEVLRMQRELKRLRILLDAYAQQEARL